MPVSSLVLTFRSDVDGHADSLKQLDEHPNIEVGPANGARIAIVVDSETREEDQEIWNWVRDLPGVLTVDVAFVGFPGSDDAQDRDVDERNDQNDH